MHALPACQSWPFTHRSLNGCSQISADSCEAETLLGKALACPGNPLGQLCVATQPSNLLQRFIGAAVQQDVLAIDKAQRRVFLVALTAGNQRTATGHGLEILDHVLAHTYVGTDEDARTIEQLQILLTRLGSPYPQRHNRSDCREHAASLSVGVP